MLDYLPELLKGLHTSLTLTVASIIVALILSLIFTIILTLKTPGLVWIVRGYITLFTGTPLLVQIFLIYYGPGQFPSLQEYPWLWHLISEPTPLSCFMAPSGRSPTGNGSPVARWE